MAHIGLIGGSGLNHWQANAEFKTVDTPYGAPSAAFEVWQTDQHTIYFLARHGAPHHLPPHLINYRANIAAFQQLGCTAIYAVNAVGGIHPEMRDAPHVVIPDQLIDYSYGREHTYADLQHVDHCEFGEPFDHALREQLIAAASVMGMPISERGVYACTQGPRLETAAEIRRLQQDGCDIVGMTAMPEAALARELNIPYASVCLVVNAAAGLSAQPISLDEIEQALKMGMHSVKRLLQTCLSFR
jgi:5'-methylthioinosine phosphorylase